MAHAYTPGLKVSDRTLLQRRRSLPVPGEVLVEAGARVQARDVVAQTFMPGDVTPVNLANLLSLPPADVPDCILRKEGEWVELDEPLARTKGMFGFFKNEYKAKVAGTVESISRVTGQVMIRGNPLPIQVAAFLTGEVIEVIPGEGCLIQSTASFIQGIFGVGGETYGPIRMACSAPDQVLTPELIRSDMSGCVVVGGGRMTTEAIESARSNGVSALVAGGLDDLDLKRFLGYDLGVAITGSEKLGLTLVITEGFGDIAMAERTYRLFARHEGAEASVNGATQIRAGVQRPEIIIPLAPDDAGGGEGDLKEAGQLKIGTLVRIIRDPNFGAIGTVRALPNDLHVLESGSRARVLEVELPSGETAVLPRANVELIEG